MSMSAPTTRCGACGGRAGKSGGQADRLLYSRADMALLLSLALTALPQNHSSSNVDLEAMEKENDLEIAALGERVGMLKSITGGIQSEALSMGGVGLSLGGAASKFKSVMAEPGGRRALTIAAVAAFALFLLYLWLR
eukprot:scaffold23.g4098.t1